MGKVLWGVGVSPGKAGGSALLYKKSSIHVPAGRVNSPEAEQAAFLRVLEEVKWANQEFAMAAGERAGVREQAIFLAHIALLEDESGVIHPILALIAGGESAAIAVSTHFEGLVVAMEGISDARLRSRAADFQELKQQLLRALLPAHPSDFPNPKHEAILVADTLTPAEMMQIEPVAIKGIVCERGGANAHAALIARALGIPAVMGCAGAIQAIREGEDLLMDGNTGEVIASPSEAEEAKYDEEESVSEKERCALAAFRGKRTVTADGKRIQILANTSTLAECNEAFANGCDGIGLFRSEYLYMLGDALPDEERLMASYREVLLGAGGKPVTIRTLDAGGDKPIPALCLPKEENPALGYRGIRISLSQPELLKVQLRALYRAGIAGKLRVMFPMISNPEEWRAVKRIAAEVRMELKEEGLPYAPDVELGMMVEVPAAALMAEAFAREADFFSIGTNDLAQYTLAADRGNARIAHLYTPYHPALCRLVHGILLAAKKQQIPCPVCGEAACDPGFVPLLLGMGLEAFSVPPAQLLPLRRQISSLSYARCADMAQKALGAETADEVQRIAKGALS